MLNCLHWLEHTCFSLSPTKTHFTAMMLLYPSSWSLTVGWVCINLPVLCGISDPAFLSTLSGFPTPQSPYPFEQPEIMMAHFPAPTVSAVIRILLECRDASSIPASEKIPWERKWQLHSNILAWESMDIEPGVLLRSMVLQRALIHQLLNSNTNMNFTLITSVWLKQPEPSIDSVVTVLLYPQGLG